MHQFSFLKFYLLIAVLSGVVLTSCKKNDSSPVNPNPPQTDSFFVIVNNGYGSGKYKVGDTVHIFSNIYSPNQVFDQWSGDAALLQTPQEWHSWFIMPAKDVSFTGAVKDITPFSLNAKMIMGVNLLKPVFYYLPPAYKGVVYLLHGTGGNAAILAGDFEWQLLMRDLINAGYGVIITEAEEATTGVDANGDGKLRWMLIPANPQTNVDYGNIQAITDTLISHGILNATSPRYSIGMSNGGFFSAALAYIFHFKASVQYCAQGPDNLMQTTSVPTQFCMAANDMNNEVGAAGNAAAFSYSTAMKARNVCSKFFSEPRSPIYPDRFARNGDMTTQLSDSVFNELQVTGYIDQRGYFVGSSDALKAALQNQSPDLPTMNTLSLNQKSFVLQQVNQCISDHHMYSDLNKATIAFLNNPCN